MNCQITRIKHSLAIAAAQYDGWLAASILGLPTCFTIQAKGMTVLMKECRAEQITFTTETTCDPQPKYENFTISQNGRELTTYQACYWSDHNFNFNGKCIATTPGNWRKPLSFKWNNTGPSPFVISTRIATDINRLPTQDTKLSSPAQ
jgi:hypothetical protein